MKKWTIGMASSALTVVLGLASTVPAFADSHHSSDHQAKGASSAQETSLAAEMKAALTGQTLREQKARATYHQDRVQAESVLTGVYGAGGTSVSGSVYGGGPGSGGTLGFVPQSVASQFEQALQALSQAQTPAAAIKQIGLVQSLLERMKEILAHDHAKAGGTEAMNHLRSVLNQSHLKLQRYEAAFTAARQRVAADLGGLSGPLSRSEFKNDQKDLRRFDKAVSKLDQKFSKWDHQILAAVRSVNNAQKP